MNLPESIGCLGPGLAFVDSSVLALAGNSVLVFAWGPCMKNQNQNIAIILFFNITC